MHFVSVENLSKSFGINPLFSSISFHISQGDKIALIARNGSGKSTLLRILAGLETADTGTVWINKEVDVILFEQEQNSCRNDLFLRSPPYECGSGL
jgi:ATP-binding cassette subfamily F protein uup